MRKMKYLKTIALVSVVAAFSLVGCGAKSIDSMTDQELYDYMNNRFESTNDLDAWADTLSEEQQERVAGVLLTYGLSDYAEEAADEWDAEVAKLNAGKDEAGVLIDEVMDTKYEKSSIWDSIDPDIPAVQFCDIVIWKGMSEEELAEQMTNSSLNGKALEYGGIVVSDNEVLIQDGRKDGYGRYSALYASVSYLEDENGEVEYDEAGNVISPMGVTDFYVNKQAESLIVCQQKTESVGDLIQSIYE